jgi:hypothetical protein
VHHYDKVDKNREVKYKISCQKSVSLSFPQLSLSLPSHYTGRILPCPTPRTSSITSRVARGQHVRDQLLPQPTCDHVPCQSIMTCKGLVPVVPTRHRPSPIPHETLAVSCGGPRSSTISADQVVNDLCPAQVTVRQHRPEGDLCSSVRSLLRPIVAGSFVRKKHSRDKF